jgi:hypothetical protein
VPIWVAHVGLAFTCELETLDVAGGEERLRKKTVARVGFEVDNARGLKVGQDLEHLKEWRQRQVQNNFDPISARPRWSTRRSPRRGTSAQAPRCARLCRCRSRWWASRGSSPR